MSTFTPYAVIQQASKPSIKDLAYRGLAAILGGPVGLAGTARHPLMQELFPDGPPLRKYQTGQVDPSIDALGAVWGPTDIIPEAVKNLTGSDTAAFLSGFVSPSSLRKAPQYLTEGQQLYRATKDPVNYQHSRRYDKPEYEFGTHVATDPKTSNFFVTEHDYDPQLLTMRSNVSKPIHVSDGRWEPGRVIERLIQENYDTLSEKTKADLLQVRNRYEHAAVSTGLSAAEQHRVMDRYAKETQRVLKKAGYDHISYTNTVEGPPVESAILFDRGATTRPTFLKNNPDLWEPLR